MARGTRMMATGLAIMSGVGMSAEAAPAAVNPGGVAAEGASTLLTPAAKIQYILHHEANDTNFRTPILTAPDERGVIEVTAANGPGGAACKHGFEVDGPIVDPVAILASDGEHIASYVGRRGEASLGTIAAKNAEVTEWIGGVAIPVSDPEALLVTRTLRNTPGVGMGAVGFTAGNGESFAMMP